MSAEQKEYLGVQVPETMAEAAREAAWVERVTLSEWLRRAILLALSHAGPASKNAEAASEHRKSA